MTVSSHCFGPGLTSVLQQLPRLVDCRWMLAAAPLELVNSFFLLYLIYRAEWASVRPLRFRAVGRQSRGLCWANGKDGARCVEVPDPAKKRGSVGSALGLHSAWHRAAVTLPRNVENRSGGSTNPTPTSYSAPTSDSNLETPSPLFRVQTSP